MTTDRSERLGIIVYVEDQATGKLTKVKAEVAAMGPAGAAAGRGLATGASSIERSAGRIGGALSHAKGAIGGLLSGPLGLLGLGAGVLTIGGAFSTGINKAQTWGLQIEKLQGITHDSAASLSGLLAVTEKYGVSNERFSQIIGFTQKALGNLSKGVDDYGHATAGAKKFQTDFGFSIYDSAGKLRTATGTFLAFSDYWVKETDRAKAAAAAAKLFGRGYADLVPILNLGSKGIHQAEQEAAALGLTLTQDNIVALAKAREATRQWGDALGGLELQLGLALLPQLTKLATWATSFVSQHGHEIVQFFTDAADFAGKAAGTIGDMAGAAAAFWGTIPGPLRDLMLKGIVADRTIHFLFGFSPIEAIGGSLLKGLTGGIFTRGSSPANPLYVSGAGVGAGGLGAMSLLQALGVAAVVIGIAEIVGPPIRDWAMQNGLAGSGPSAGKTDAQLAWERMHPPITASGGASLEDRDARNAAIATQNGIAATKDLDASVRYAAQVFHDADWLKRLEASWQKAGQTMHDKIRAAMTGLSGPHSGAAASFLGAKLGNAGFGAGGYNQAVAVLATLKGMQQSLQVVAAERAITGRLPRLKLDRDDLAAAEKIAQSADPKNKKLDELNRLMADLRAHGDRTAQHKLQDIITAVHNQRTHVSVKVPITANTTVYVSPDERPGRSRTSVSGTALVQSTQSAREYSQGGRFPPGFRLVHGPELQVDDRSGYIFNAARTGDVMRAASAIAGANGGTSGSGGSDARIERLIAAVEGLAGRSVQVKASARDMERAQVRRASYGPTRSRQLAIAP